jgi:hypothetical protein
VWVIGDDEALSMQQKIWNFVYGDKIPHIITVQGPVFILVCISILCPSVLWLLFIHIDQRVCEWHGGFSSAALSIVNAFFDDNNYDSDHSHQEFANDALEVWSFLYCDLLTDEDGTVVSTPN